MARPIVTEAQLRRTHRALRIATPFDAMSDMLRAAVAAAARAMAKRDQHRSHPHSVDLKRRAAGDFED
ncbi:hypothetical protein [Cupriavidus metallidurans]|uniref:hypothetical protein n=1 Tax=Cupriavidus metallidurans TaxID=119219 RepID=UPI001CC949C6|nr:hypothetical protein [Cupriavidus metallidurans]UBM11707.1 hypothetical protein LAI70_15310 [Cupriavidus metallidurans]